LDSIILSKMGFNYRFTAFPFREKGGYLFEIRNLFAEFPDAVLVFGLSESNLDELVLKKIKSLFGFGKNRKRDRETERQRDRETENRETERQKERGKERKRERDREKN